MSIEKRINMAAISLKQVKERRFMPFLKRGMQVEVNEKLGVVTAGNSSGNINVRFEDVRFSINCHPKWETRYFAKDGSVIADYRKRSGKVR